MHARCYLNSEWIAYLYLFSQKQSIMLNFLKVSYVILALFSSKVLGQGCQQCTGTQTLTFTNYILPERATTFFLTKFWECATGRDYKINGVTSSNCLTGCISRDMAGNCVQTGNLPQCKTFNINVSAWRYCGTGGSVKLTKNNYCLGVDCAVQNELVMTCTRNVQCGGTCYCNQCGC